MMEALSFSETGRLRRATAQTGGLLLQAGFPGADLAEATGHWKRFARCCRLSQAGSGVDFGSCLILLSFHVFVVCDVKSRPTSAFDFAAVSALKLAPYLVSLFDTIGLVEAVLST